MKKCLTALQTKLAKKVRFSFTVYRFILVVPVQEKYTENMHMTSLQTKQATEIRFSLTVYIFWSYKRGLLKICIKHPFKPNIRKKYAYRSLFLMKKILNWLTALQTKHAKKVRFRSLFTVRNRYTENKTKLSKTVYRFWLFPEPFFLWPIL